jgi:ribose 5-phosphate isomerase B
MRIALASDHAGFSLKKEIEAVLQGQGLETRDFGTHDEEACDLSDFVYPAALAVGRGEWTGASSSTGSATAAP